MALLTAVAVATACAPLEPQGSLPPARPAAPAALEPSKTPSAGMRLVFADDFNGDSIDHGKWDTQLAWGRTNGEELQYYSEDALNVSDGLLTITASDKPTGDRAYTSGIIATFDKFQFEHGYVEMRARVLRGQGLWPAFWLLSVIPKDPREIDIAEFVGQNPYRVQMSNHWGLGAMYKATQLYTGPDFSADFHTFGMDWESDHIAWYVDGVERFRVTDHIPDVKMYVVANLAIGGRYSGLPDQSTAFPATYQIDYVRVYSRD